jgi:cell division cycle 2-like protein
VKLREVVTGQGDTKGDVYLVMDFLEHDLKTLQEDMDEPFLPSETKTLMLQLGSAVDFLHSHCILHRDLKTSNILMNNRGEVQLADFGMARSVGHPAPRNLTQLVVTLWYRSPELLLGTTTYDSAIDLWSLGCIFGELLTRQPLLPGKNEVDQLSKVSPATQSPSPWRLERNRYQTYALPLTFFPHHRSLNSAAYPPKKRGRASSASPTHDHYDSLPHDRRKARLCDPSSRPSQTRGSIS